MTKRSVNFARTRKPRNPIADATAFLRDLGYTDEQIAEAMRELAADPGKICDLLNAAPRGGESVR